MTKTKDLQTIGLPADTTDKRTIKKAYFKLALVRHPDKRGYEGGLPKADCCFRETAG